MPQQDFSAIAEALRRRQGQLPSSAGIPGAGANTPSNVMAQQGQVPTGQLPQAGLPQGTQGNPMGGAIQAQANAKPDQSEMITRALIKQQERLTPDPNKVPQQPQVPSL